MAIHSRVIIASHRTVAESIGSVEVGAEEGCRVPQEEYRGV